MARELPLLIGTVGIVLGFISLLGALLLLFLFSASSGEIVASVFPLLAEASILVWVASPFIGLAGAFKVKKRAHLGGSLFVAAGALPLIVSAGAFLEYQFWTPLLILAGILAILNWPGPYVDEEERSGTVGGDSTSLS